jgi:hypothetical protein
MSRTPGHMAGVDREHHDRCHLQRAPMNNPCPQPSPLLMLTEPTCKRESGHEPPHRFTSLDGKTDLEQMTTAKELAR